MKRMGRYRTLWLILALAVVGDAGIAEASEAQAHAEILERFRDFTGPDPNVPKWQAYAELSASVASIKKEFLRSSWPRYPKFALRQRLSGNGIVCLHVDEQGRIVRARMLASTGHASLDGETLKSVREWQAKTGDRRHFDIPVFFVLPDPR